MIYLNDQMTINPFIINRLTKMSATFHYTGLIVKILRLSAVVILISCSSVYAADMKPVDEQSGYYLKTSRCPQCVDPEEFFRQEMSGGLLQLIGQDEGSLIYTDRWIAGLLSEDQLPKECIPDGSIDLFWNRHPYAAAGLIKGPVCKACSCPATFYICVQSSGSPEILKEQGYAKVGE